MKFESIEQADKHFYDLGFHKYTNHFAPRGVVAHYQKCITDDIGKKYFVDARLWDFTDCADKYGFNYTDEYGGQYYMKDDHKAFNVTYLDWGYEDVIEFIEILFNKGLLDYYERWDE